MSHVSVNADLYNITFFRNSFDYNANTTLYKKIALAITRATQDKQLPKFQLPFSLKDLSRLDCSYSTTTLCLLVAPLAFITLR